MAEQTTMTEENKKTIIAFIVGLLVGGLLVYVFAMPADTDRAEDNNDDNVTEETDMEDDEDSSDMTDEENDATSTNGDDQNGDTPTGSVDAGNGRIVVNDQGAASMVVLEDVTFPTDAGWIGVRDYENGQMTGLLGVARWNQADGLLPNTIKLLRPTVAGRTYAVVFYSDNGDRQFNLATDIQMTGAMSTFTAR